jgi:uncharacterized protein YyaL (SSP411 family)
MPPNRLAREKSPYLLQHAHNPVDWYPWGDEAFEKAARENKPVFLSVGYSTCHWCHVMERESFEDEATAALLNEHFVPVKVDREERPDVDRIYMLFVQASTGSGGWPMSVFLTPDRKPFYGGTYFPPDNRYGRPGFGAILQNLAQAWTKDRERIEASGSQVIEQLRGYSTMNGGHAAPGREALEHGFNAFRRVFDSKLGGFGGAPKFPRPSVHNFLLRYYVETGNAEALEMVLLTLREMAKGGMHDQLGGGFHRYSVDEYWFVPHFEKMLYDQAQLVIAYLEAFQITHDAVYATAARRTLDYVLRDLTHPDGGFFSAEDADSAADPAKPHEKGEGAFYIWSRAELEHVLGSRDAAVFSYRFGAEENGNVQHDPHQEFTGRNILFEAHSVDETAVYFGNPVADVAGWLDQAAKKLVEARNRRPRPGLDDKVLTSWNGLMISAFAKAGQALSESKYAEGARRAADFLRQRLWIEGRAVLLRRFRDDDSAIDGFLDDYACFAAALVDLYETSFDAADLKFAERIATRAMELFEDPEKGGFFSTAAGGPDLVLRLKDDYDGAEPSGNSILTLALLRLARITGREDFRNAAERTLKLFSPHLHDQPSGVPQMLVANWFALARPMEIVLAGEPSAELLREIRGRFLPRAVVMRASEAAIAMPAIDGNPTSYVCENFACKLPVTEGAQLAELLK